MNRRSFLSSAGALVAGSQLAARAGAANTEPPAASTGTILPGDVAGQAAARLSRFSNLERLTK